MSRACAACGTTELRPHLSVRHSDGESLVATTTSYGSAPGDIFKCRVCGHMQVADLPPRAEVQQSYEEVSERAYLDEQAGQRATAAQALDRIERHT